MNPVVKNMPFHLQAYQIMREAILNGKMKPGERLLEARLAQELGVSRSPIREAMRILEQDGLVITNENGTVVNPMELRDVQEVYQCRIATEPYAGFLAAGRISATELVELSNLVEQAEQAHHDSNYALVVELNTAFHDLIVSKCGNVRLREIIDRISSLIILARNTELRTYSRSIEYLTEHREIVRTLKEGKPEQVETVLRKHIENDWKYYLAHAKDVLDKQIAGGVEID